MMTRTDLDARHTAIMRKWARTLADRDGDPPRGLLDDLAELTAEYAIAPVVQPQGDICSSAAPVSTEPSPPVSSTRRKSPTP